MRKFARMKKFAAWDHRKTLYDDGEWDIIQWNDFNVSVHHNCDPRGPGIDRRYAHCASCKKTPPDNILAIWYATK